MSLLSQLVDLFYPRTRNRYRITLAGLPGSGKTSLMYLLKKGELVRTISTVGYTVETVRWPSLSIRGSVTTTSDEVDLWDTGMRGGQGAAYFGALEQHAKYGDALIWMDSCAEGDGDHLWGGSVEQLRIALEFIENKEPGYRKSKSRPLLVLVNKQDLPDGRSMDEMRTIFGSVLSNRPLCTILPISVKQKLVKESGIPQAFDWLRSALTGKAMELNVQQSRSSLLSHPASELNEWFSRLKGDLPPDELLVQFYSGPLPTWDHYSKVRVIFQTIRKYGRDDGGKFLLDRLKRLADGHNVPKEVQEFHFTMTYFWMQIIQLGILRASFPASVESHKPGKRKGDFIRFLAANPDVVNDRLWREYYSKGVMQSQHAKNKLATPDRKPIPSFVARHPVDGGSEHRDKSEDLILVPRKRHPSYNVLQSLET